MTRGEAMMVYEDRSKKFINTQAIQWKMNLSIWTLLTLAIFYKHQLDLPSCVEHFITLKCGLEIFVGSILIFIHSKFCYKIQWSLDSDKAVKDDIVDQLNADTKEINVQLNLAKEPLQFKPWEWIMLQVAITLVLVIVFCISGL
jgi:Sec-independent protein secretion pathway component TatC